MLARGVSVFRELDWHNLHWKLRSLDKPVDFLVLKSSRVRFAEVSFRNYLYMARNGIIIVFIWAITYIDGVMGG